LVGYLQQCGLSVDALAAHIFCNKFITTIVLGYNLVRPPACEKILPEMVKITEQQMYIKI
jgi:hypothetical protein